MSRLVPLVLFAVPALATVGLGLDPKESAEVVFAPTGGDHLVQKRVVREIGAARRKVSAAIYQFTSKDIAQALIAAKNRGVEVRVLVDGVQADGTKGVWAEALEALAGAKVPIRKVYPAEGRPKERQSEALRPKFHNKFLVIDGERVVTGSYNWTVLADEQNYENLLVLPGAQIASKYVEYFDRIWKDEKLTEEWTAREPR